MEYNYSFQKTLVEYYARCSYGFREKSIYFSHSPLPNKLNISFALLKKVSPTLPHCAFYAFLQKCEKKKCITARYIRLSVRRSLVCSHQPLNRTVLK